ncbi:hypothetical protein ACRAWG_32265 [Methylobacterium sp. P31]
MRIVHRIARRIESMIVGTVALVSGALDATIGLVGRFSERLDVTLSDLAREAKERRVREGHRQIDPITLK